jgi:alkylhydroperoxidase/carboxymuconolactone decarboxylase family protein YurZ
MAHTAYDSRTTLRRLAIRDDAFVHDAMASEAANLAQSHLDAKTHAIVRLAATIAVGGDESSYRQVVEDARRTGATTDEIVGTLIAVMTTTGVPRVVAAAPAVGLAIGYDVNAALEELDAREPEPGRRRTHAPRRGVQSRPRKQQ